MQGLPRQGGHGLETLLEENLVNEAALLAARKDQSEVHARDFSEALEKITLGPARHILLNPAEAHRLPRERPRACSGCSSRAATRCPA